jgi:hypothetical protein
MAAIKGDGVALDEALGSAQAVEIETLPELP